METESRTMDNVQNCDCYLLRLSYKVESTHIKNTADKSDKHVISEAVLTNVNMKSTAFWDVTPCTASIIRIACLLLVACSIYSSTLLN
jgi:hypothetical protein